MTKQGKVELTAEYVEQVLAEQKPTSLSGLAVALGRSKKVSNDFKAALVRLVPDVVALVAANKAGVEVLTGEPPKPKTEMPVETPKVETPKVETPVVEMPKVEAVARAEKNPFRAGSDYALCFDLLAANPQGIERKALVAEQARLTSKEVKLAGYDVIVVASVRQDGGSHRNVKRVAGLYYVERAEGKLRLVLR